MSSAERDAAADAAIHGPTLERSDLTSAARERDADATGAGWGSHYPGPLVQDEDKPLLEPGAAIEDPGPWADEVDRDIRSDPAERR